MIPYVMLYTVVAGIPILLGAAAVAAILRRYGRPERAVWVCGLVLAFALPAASLLDPVRGTPAAASLPSAGVIGLPEVVAVPVAPSAIDVGRVLVAMWLTVSLLMALRWMIATLRLLRASRSWRPGMLDGVPVLMTEDVGPAVTGVLRPRVLAPRWLTLLPARERELILMHEEEHVRARDPMLVAVSRAARILAPWNPVVWALTARLVRAVELDCDRRVLKRTSDIAAYGHTLLNVSARKPGRLVAAAAFAESEAPLRSRILAMTTPSQSVSVAAILAATVLGVVLLVGAFGVPVPTVSLDVRLGGAAEDRPDQTPTVTHFDTPPTPPAAPPAPPAPPIDHHAPATLPTVPGATRVIQLSAQQVPEPAFSPMTVRPTLTNADVVQQALMREYPAVLRDAGIGGAPVLWIYIDESGAVAATRIHETSGYEALDQAAMNVARAMVFTPARNDDQIVATWVQIPIRFQVVN
ncbi:MAG: TonB family protein [Gemmatimonadales bacterium]